MDTSSVAPDMSIAVETPLSDNVRALVMALNEFTQTLTPVGYRHHMTVGQMAQADTTLFVAREDGRAVAMGALRRHGDGVAEVKRMYTLPSHQGRGLGRAILARIEQLAREEGFARLVLETGSNFDAACHVYERAGFAVCGPVLDYPPSDWTAFYEKALTSGASA
jgi:putative acetyltransferase